MTTSTIRPAATSALAAFAVAAAAAAALTACGADPAGGRAAPAPDSSTVPGAQPPGDAQTMTDPQLLTIGRRYAACLRDHGVAGYPDLVLVAGRLTLPDTAAADAAEQALRADPAAREACATILAELPATAQKNHAPSAADRQRLLQYAQCLRTNGVPEWPDPAADGSFPIAGTALGDEGKSARLQTATQACKKYWDQEISVK